MIKIIKISVILLSINSTSFAQAILIDEITTLPNEILG